MSKCKKKSKKLWKILNLQFFLWKIKNKNERNHIKKKKNSNVHLYVHVFIRVYTCHVYIYHLTCRVWYINLSTQIFIIIWYILIIHKYNMYKHVCYIYDAHTHKRFFSITLPLIKRPLYTISVFVLS